MSYRRFRAGGGANFTWTAWEPRAAPVARAVLLHGMGSAASEFAPLGEALAARGYLAQAPNLRANGHDPDPRRRGHGFSFSEYREDFLAFLEAVEKDRPEQKNLPRFLVGESMGALLSVCFLSEPQIAARFRGAVLLAPVFELAHPTPGWMKKLFRAFAAIFPRAVISPAYFIHGKDEPVPLTRDAGYQAYTLTAPHRVARFTAGFTAGVGRLMEEASRLAPEFRVPFLLLNGGDDIFITPEQSAAWFRRAGSCDKTHKVFPGSRHLLLHELNTGEVLEEILGWLEARSSG